MPEIQRLVQLGVPPPVAQEMCRDCASHAAQMAWNEAMTLAVASIATTPGPVGPKGDKGDTGAQGLPGAAGPQGATGATGAQGAKGDTGNQGAAGSTGPTGANGLAGATGATGATGPAGADGAPGLTFIGNVTITETLLVSLSLGMKRMTLALAGIVAGTKLQAVPNGTPSTGCEVVNAYPASNGNVSIGYFIPALGIGATYSIPVSIYRVAP